MLSDGRFANEISAGVKRLCRRLAAARTGELRAQLDRMVLLVQRVMQQTRVRVFRGGTPRRADIIDASDIY
jgi:hypothetical protein